MNSTNETDTRKALDAIAFGVMLVLSMTWGCNRSRVKVTVAGIPPLLQGVIRSLIPPARRHVRSPRPTGN